jgi:hypothetical protein
MEEITWPYGFNEASQDKSTWKSGSTSLIWELAGIDGTNQGSLTAHPGFIEAWTFRFDQIAGASFGGTNPYATSSRLAKVVDFWPFTIRIGPSSYAYGVVYIAVRPSSSTRDILVDGYRTDTGAYFQDVVYAAPSGIGSGSTFLSGYDISVSSTPRAVYVCVRGQVGKCIAFSNTANGANYSLKITDSGPGVKPFGSTSTTTSAPVPTVTQLPTTGTATNPRGSFLVYGTTTSPTGTTAWYDRVAGAWTSASTQRAGDYSFAVQFEDSTTGRRSMLSDVQGYTFTGADRKIQVVGILDTNVYDTVKIWRSVRTTNAAGVFTNGILQLEATFNVVSGSPTQVITGVTDPAWSPAINGTTVRWAYVCQKSDRQLVMQDTFQDKPSFYANVPFGGASASYQSQLFVSNISGQIPDKEDQMRSVGEIRWSSPSDGSYELFNPKSRWNPDMFGDVPIAFAQAGQLLLGFSKNRVFFIVRDGAFVRVSTAHNGYGVTGPYALSTIGPLVYYVTKQGIRAVYPDGRLDEIGALDWLISKDWYDDLASISMAFDPDTTALYILNPVKKKAAVMWFSSGVASELHYLPFQKCARGFWSQSSATPGGELSDTTLFLVHPDNYFEGGAIAGDQNYRPRLMMPALTSTSRRWTPPVLNTTNGVHYGMIDGACDRSVTATQAVVNVSGTDYFSFTWTQIANEWVPDWTIIGAYLMVLGSNDPVEVIQGNKFSLQIYQIVDISVSGGTNVLYCRFIPDMVTTPYVDGAVQVHLAVNPVTIKVETSNVPGGNPKNPFMSNKQISSAGVMMTGVSNITLAAPVFKRWFLNHYVGDATKFSQTAFPTNPSNNSVNATSVATVVDGPSPVHAAFAERILNPMQSVQFVANAVNQNFRLLAMNVRGRILETERNKNSYA